MRWVDIRNAALATTLALGIGNTGCTVAVLQGAAEDPSVLAALPFALIGDAIVHGIKAQAASGSVTIAPQAPPSLATWRDPDDWVADCDGPTLCADYQHFQCSGVPGDCSCECVVSRPAAASVARLDPGATAPSAKLAKAR